MIKIIGINGSPKKPVDKSNTHYLLKTVLENIVDDEISTELINLNEYNILNCIGCEVCTTKSCPLDSKEEDQFAEIEEKLLEADVIIIGSPSYWSLPPVTLKNLFDRSRDLKMPVMKLKNKIISAVTVSGLRNGGQESVINSIMSWGLSHGMIVAGATGHPHFNSSFPQGTIMYDTMVEEKNKVKFRHVKRDPISMKDAQKLGERLLYLSKKISPQLKEM